MKGSEPHASWSEVTVYADDGNDGEEPSEGVDIGQAGRSISLGTRFPLSVCAPFQCSLLCNPQIPWLSDKCFDGVFSL